MLKKLLILPFAIAAAVSFAAPAVACGDKVCTECEAPATSLAPKPIKGEAATTVFQVAGLKCGKCVNAVNSKLSAVPGVSKVDTSLAKHSVTVVHAKGQVDLPKLQAALGDHFKLAVAAPVVKTAAPAEDCCAEGNDACEDKPAPKK